MALEEERAILDELDHLLKELSEVYGKIYERIAKQAGDNKVFAERALKFLASG